MKREDIEKAALRYKSELIESIVNYTDINYEENNYEAGKMHALDDNIEDTFKAGAEWRINRVWHDANKKPDKGKLLIAEDIDSAYDLVYLTKSKPWEELSEKNHYMRWAYIADLLPDTEE